MRQQMRLQKIKEKIQEQSQAINQLAKTFLQTKQTTSLNSYREQKQQNTWQKLYFMQSEVIKIFLNYSLCYVKAQSLKLSINP